MRQRFRLRKAVTVLGISAALTVVVNLHCPSVRAAYGPWDALETVGISTGIGAVLGLSTISFYEKPTSHMKNAFVGAGLGAIVGIGVAAYLMATTPEQDEISPEEVLPPENRPGGKDGEKQKEGQTTGAVMPGASKLGRYRTSRRPGYRHLASIPVSAMSRPEWSVALEVLELRF